MKSNIKKMKKVIILTAMALGFSIVASSQVKFGPKLGINLASTSDIELTENGQTGKVKYNEIIAGFLVGGYVNYAFNNCLGAQGEVVFSMQGGKGENTIRLNYINIPVLLDVKPFNKLPLSILAGPQVGLCFNRSLDGKRVSRDGTGYTDFDFAIAVGAQYTVVSHLTLGVRYNIGLTPTFSIPGISEGAANHLSSEGGRNRVIQISADWTF